MGLLRYQIFLSYTGALVSIWILILRTNHGDHDYFQFQTYTDIGVVLAPLWCVVGLGVYLLSLLLYGVLTYQDCPEAARELEKEISEAKNEMKQRGIIS
jgi:Dolichol-phosphate mannosyltransferase subunit 3 (DPM3)